MKHSTMQLNLKKAVAIVARAANVLKISIFSDYFQGGSTHPYGELKIVRKNVEIQCSRCSQQVATAFFRLIQSNCCCRHSMYKQAGTSLIEILISVIILAIGLLGLAALQINSTHFNHSAYLRSVAVSQANDIIDRMRANPNGVDDGDYNNLSGTPAHPGCSSCTPAEIAQLDLFEWNSANASLLPSGQGIINISGNHMNITLMWDNDRSGATGTGCSGDSSVDLTCLTMGVQL